MASRLSHSTHDSPRKNNAACGQVSYRSHGVTTLRESAVPLDNRAMQALKGSSLALDLYAMLAHRLHRIEGRVVQLHWHQVKDQFGQEYQGIN